MSSLEMFIFSSRTTDSTVCSAGIEQLKFEYEAPVRGHGKPHTDTLAADDKPLPTIDNGAPPATLLLKTLIPLPILSLTSDRNVGYTPEEVTAYPIGHTFASTEYVEPSNGGTAHCHTTERDVEDFTEVDEHNILPTFTADDPMRNGLAVVTLAVITVDA